MFFLLRFQPKRHNKRRISFYMSKFSFFCITGTSTLFKNRHKIFFLSITSLFLTNKNIIFSTSIALSQSWRFLSTEMLMILSLSPNFSCNCFTLGIAARQGPHQEAQKSMKLYLPGTMISFKLIDFLSLPEVFPRNRAWWLLRWHHWSDTTIPSTTQRGSRLPINVLVPRIRIFSATPDYLHFTTHISYPIQRINQNILIRTKVFQWGSDSFL